MGSVEPRTVGLACREELLDNVRSVITGASLDLAWITHSFDICCDSLASPSVVLAECSPNFPGFWQFLEEMINRSPGSTVVAFGPANVREAFRLAALGVDRYLESLVAEELTELDHVPAAAECLISTARKSVGQLGVKEAQRLIRAEMFRTALERTAGNRHAAARMLGVDRRYVLKMLWEHPEIASARARETKTATARRKLTDDDI